MKNVPNILTITRLIIVPIFLFFSFATFCPANLYIALVLFIIGAVTDFLDGYLARKYNVISNIGKFLDPIADKVLFLAGLIVIVHLLYTTNYFSDVFTYLIILSVFVILTRDYIVDAIRQIASANGKIIPADIFGKLKTMVQDIALPLLLLYFAIVINSGLANQGFVLIFGYVAMALYFVGVLLAIASGINYFVKNKKILFNKE